MMKSQFELKEKFEFTPPFQFLAPEVADLDVYKDPIKLTTKRVQSGIIWVASKRDFEKKFGLLKHAPNKFRVFAQLYSPEMKVKGSFKKLENAGLGHRDIKKIHGVSLGVNLVKAIEQDPKNMEVILKDYLSWTGTSRAKDETAYLHLKGLIGDFVTEFPSEVFEAPKGYEEFVRLLQQCLILGVEGVSDIAKFLADEVFIALANEIKKIQLPENKWNPNSKDKKGNPNYDPLFSDFSSFEKQLELFFKGISFDTGTRPKDNVVANVYSGLVVEVTRLLQWFKRVLLAPLKVLNEYIRENNALVVGFINGLIKAVASMVEGIGFLIGLLNKERMFELVTAIQQLAENFDWSLITGLIMKEVQKFFAFVAEKDKFKLIYQIGEFIPNLIELVVSLITGARAAQKVAKSIVEIVKDFPKHAAKLHKEILGLRNMLLFDLDRKLLKAMKKEGIQIKASFSMPPVLGLNNVKLEITNKRFDVVFDDYVIKSFSSEKEVNDFMKKMKYDLDLEAEKFSLIFKDYFEEKKWKVYRTNRSKKKLDILDENGVIIFRGRPSEVRKFLRFTRLPKNERERLITLMNVNIAENSKITPYSLSRDNSKIYNVPMSEAGGTPDFKGLKKYLNKEGSFGKLEVNGLPDGVSQAELDEVIEKIEGVGGVVKARITGLNRGADFKNSWVAMGVDPNIGEKIRVYFKLTWHHMDDLDENLMSGMQLILTKVHNKTTPHIGSHAQMKELLKLIELN